MALEEPITTVEYMYPVAVGFFIFVTAINPPKASFVGQLVLIDYLANPVSGVNQLAISLLLL
ncbi:hypothetical protein LM499_30400 [Pseudomonas aeruginosa]|uniref:hypothetical protein n=1 Tax=Pseudomonas aeruginosa TaxID=287 RepID=UPI0013C41A60|nr:hypothetical protein [Pseudomonas aeruginosa]ELL1256105.1 hypothetical protein [Pseudomonas aeruginosa]ELM1688287.1 hypothetical protein [Pseudomonas aeruginosa]EMA3567136.1 hypothetical protein [Pseudomonas aeruginosa]MBI7170387.1 hypothetical protein [Pseudomonas aeruginosa]MCQ9800565.1 hypothetical protein [Pseudomonas aeruginosa]